MKLTEKSSSLYTFNTPFGRNKVNRMQFRIKSANDVAKSIIEGYFGELLRLIPIHDDLIIAGHNISEHDLNVKNVLDRTRNHNLKFSKKKSKFNFNK